MTTRSSREREGMLLHARHALAPNSLGYCGPDENGKILDGIRGSAPAEGLASVLEKFEAAYPFIRMIGEATGRSPFDYSVTEAYWIGNSLLDRVPPGEFYDFVHQGLKKPMKKDEARELFKESGLTPRPHHTFYVLSLFGRSDSSPTSESALTRLMDSCRISWGEVTDVRKKELVLSRAPLAISDGRLGLAAPRRESVKYDVGIPGFGGIEEGDWVSVHWGFASEKLTRRQTKNIAAYTAVDLAAANRFAAIIERRGKSAC